MMEKLQEDYKNGRLILFAGAGFSGDLGLPDWSAMINEIGRQLDYDPEVFNTYGNYLALAEYYKLSKGSMGSLRSWMDREWHNPSIRIGNSKVHETVAKGNFPLIYTTNYDRWIEMAHDHYGVKYNKIASVSDLAKNNPSGREIVKFHGDFDDDASIVMDESSYFERLQFDTPLDIKLRADVLGKSVLFLGYSLSDINIRHLFFKLSRIWNADVNRKVRPMSYVFTSRQNPIQAALLKNWGIETITADEDNQGKALTAFLQKLTGV